VLIRDLTIAGAAVIEPQVFSDPRGAFLEWFRADTAAEALGRRVGIVQANLSVSARGVVRGVHYADVPPGQAKWVSVPRGRIIDYVVDLRVGSPTFGATEAVELDSESRRAVFLAEGLGHAFVALEHDTLVSYLVTDVFRPDKEHGISPADPELGLDFPVPAGELILSAKDTAAPTLAEAIAAGALPTWEACQTRYAELAVRV